jgi:hypothetical protein
MKTTKLTLLLLVLFTGVISCNKEKDIDTEKPSINIDFTGSFPVNCDTLYFGEAFNLKAKFTDNVELGSFSIGIHHNFDHHSHTTEVTECSLDPVKDPVNAFTFIEDYEIAAGLGAYATDVEIAIPSGDANGSFDEGDYHFFISLTDHEGWSNQKGLSIKMLYR